MANVPNKDKELSEQIAREMEEAGAYYGLKTIFPEMTFDGKERDYEMTAIMSNGSERDIDFSAVTPKDVLAFIRETNDDIERDNPYNEVIASVSDIHELQKEEQKSDLTDKPLRFCVNTGYGNEELAVRVNRYVNGGGLYVGLVCTEDGYMSEPYGDLTKNLDITPPPFHAYVDTNNMPAPVIEVLKSNGLMEETGESRRSGYCTYPLMKFSEEALMQLDPENTKDYKEHVGQPQQAAPQGQADWKKDLMDALGLTDEDIEGFEAENDEDDMDAGDE